MAEEVNNKLPDCSNGACSAVGKLHSRPARNPATIQDVALADTSVLQLLSLGRQGHSPAVAQPPAWPDGRSMVAPVTCVRPKQHHIDRISDHRSFC